MHKNDFNIQVSSKICITIIWVMCLAMCVFPARALSSESREPVSFRILFTGDMAGELWPCRH